MNDKQIIEKLKELLSEAVHLLMAAKCPNCDGGGIVGDSDDDYQPCEWCFYRDQFKDENPELALLEQQNEGKSALLDQQNEGKEETASVEINYKDCLTFVNDWLWESPERKSDCFDRDQTNDAARILKEYTTLKVNEALKKGKADHSASPTLDNTDWSNVKCIHPERYRFKDKDGYERCSSCHGYV